MSLLKEKVRSKSPCLYSTFDFFVDFDCNHLSLCLENWGWRELLKFLQLATRWQTFLPMSIHGGSMDKSQLRALHILGISYLSFVPLSSCMCNSCSAVGHFVKLSKFSFVLLAQLFTFSPVRAFFFSFHLPELCSIIVFIFVLW